MSLESAAHPHQPLDSTGPGFSQPIFSQPWEAQVFSMTLLLHQRGVFSWAEWSDALGAQIALARRQGDPDLGDTYYRHWVAALEGLLARKGLIASLSQPGT